MTVVGRQVSVLTSVTKLVDNGSSSDRITARVHNKDVTNSVFLGGPTVAATGGAAGYELEKDAEREFSLDPQETLWAISGTATVRVDVLTSG